MPSTAATTYQECIDFATRNVWTQYNASQNLRSRLDQMRQAVFAIEDSGVVVPAEVQRFDALMLEQVNSLINAVPTTNDELVTGPVVDIIQRVTAAFRDNTTTSAAGFETPFVAAFNAAWV